ncbi:MAG: Arc family DNA-binding protein [Acidobacteriota bacterium]
MPTLHVRGVPKEVYKKLKKRAANEKRSISAETIIILRDALERPFVSQKELLDRIKERSSRYNPAKAGAPSTTQLIREDRSR